MRQSSTILARIPAKNIAIELSTEVVNDSEHGVLLVLSAGFA